MRYLEAPTLDPGPCEERSLFLAGGIQGCPQWQARLVRLTVYVCLIPFFPLRVVIGPRLHQPD